MEAVPCIYERIFPDKVCNQHDETVRDLASEEALDTRQ